MCGIFGYLSDQDNNGALDACIQGLRALEYRGYDSAGIAGVSEGELKTIKRVGKVSYLEEAAKQNPLLLNTAIAHTRWATHGKLTEVNAHPHFDQTNSLALVHNGIIENFYELKRHLMDHGFNFASETDSEVIAQLLSHHYNGDLIKAFRKTLPLLRGSYALAVLHKDHPDTMIATAHECPLVLARNPMSGEVFVSSDTNALNGNLDIFFLKDNETALIRRGSVEVYSANGEQIAKQSEALGIHTKTVSKDGYDHYMLKEIFEQPTSIKNTLQDRYSEEFGTATLSELVNSRIDLQGVQHAIILGCGTSWHAGCIAASMFESTARIPTQAEIASEFRYTNPIVSENTLVVAISQSGETADTLAAVREVKAKGAKVIGICNVKNSTLTREAHCCLFLNAGPEISVCSTKAFTSQIVLLSLLNLHLSRMRHMGKEQGQIFIRQLRKLPRLVETVLHKSSELEALSRKYAHFNHFFFLGRRYMYPSSLEAALKLKEISYLNAIGYPAGEMKHGPIALINPELAVVAMCGNKQTQDKMVSNLMEIKLRGSPIIIFGPKNSNQLIEMADDYFAIPSEVCDELSCVPYSVAAQLFAYYIAKERKTDIDQPRNLAKSVTVE